MTTAAITYETIRAALKTGLLAEGLPLGPVIVPEWLYDMAVAEGYDMTGYVRREPIPTMERSDGR